MKNNIDTNISNYLKPLSSKLSLPLERLSFHSKAWLWIIAGLLAGALERGAASTFPLPIPTRPTSFPLSRPWPPGKVVAWGNGGSGQTNVPPDLTNVVAISAQYGSSMALKSDGTVVGWGHNPYGGDVTVPTGLTGVVAIAAGYHNMTLLQDGTVVDWGDMSLGQTTAPAGLNGVVGIAQGAFFSAVLKQDGTVLSWGQYSSPAGLSNIVTIAAGSCHTLALKQDGTVIPESGAFRPCKSAF